MKFRFESRVRAIDMWKLSMNHIYHSMVGVCNIIFSVAVILLTLKFWSEVGAFLKILLIFGCILFPILHPMMIFLRSAKQVEDVPKDLVIAVDDNGLHITGDGREELVPWKRVRGTMLERGMVLLVINAGRGYLLTDKVLGTQKDAFLQFVEEKVKKNK